MFRPMLSQKKKQKHSELKLSVWASRSYCLLLLLITGVILCDKAFPERQNPQEPTAVNSAIPKANCVYSESAIQRSVNECYQTLKPIADSLQREVERKNYHNAEKLADKLISLTDAYYKSPKIFVPPFVNVFLRKGGESLISAHSEKALVLFEKRLKWFSNPSSRHVDGDARISALIDYASAGRRLAKLEIADKALNEADSLVNSKTSFLLKQTVLIERSEVAFCRGDLEKAILGYRRNIALWDHFLNVSGLESKLPTQGFPQAQLCQALYRHGELCFTSRRFSDGLASFRRLNDYKKCFYVNAEINYATYRALNQIRPSQKILTTLNFDRLPKREREQLNDFLRSTRSKIIDEFWDGFSLSFASRGGAAKDSRARLTWCHLKTSSLDQK